MKVLFIPALLALSFSCSNEIELGQKSGILFLKDVTPEIKEVRDIEWKVGKEREETVSKGLTLEIETPKISEQAANVLYQKHGIDSWIYRVVKINRGSRTFLGNVAVNAYSSRHISESFSLHLYYHAASVSQEFRRFHCPAFGHRKIILEHSLEDNPSRPRNHIFARPSGKVQAAVSEISFSPLIFSVGSDMSGEYLIEFALYNSKDNKLLSDWTPLENLLSVKKEGSIKVESCAGIREELNPLPGSRAPRIEDLRLR